MCVDASVCPFKYANECQKWTLYLCVGWYLVARADSSLRLLISNAGTTYILNVSFLLVPRVQ